VTSTTSALLPPMTNPAMGWVECGDRMAKKEKGETEMLRCGHFECRRKEGKYVVGLIAEVKFIWPPCL
jgi:hypothetical protein